MLYRVIFLLGKKNEQLAGSFPVIVFIKATFCKVVLYLQFMNVRKSGNNNVIVVFGGTAGVVSAGVITVMLRIMDPRL